MGKDNNTINRAISMKRSKIRGNWGSIESTLDKDIKSLFSEGKKREGLLKVQ